MSPGWCRRCPQITIGASFGAAFLAAGAVAERHGAPAPDITDWNPVTRTITPDPAVADLYDARFDQYLRLYEASKAVVHELAAEQRGRA